MSNPLGHKNEGRPNGAAFFIALGLAALGCLLIWQGMVLPEKGGYAGIGSGAAPVGIGAVLIVLALAHVVTGLKSGPLPPMHQNWGAIGWILLGLLAQLFLLKPLGFSVASALLFACTARAMGYRKLHIAFAAGLVLALGVHGVFDGILKLNLPSGLLEQMIYGG